MASSSSISAISTPRTLRPQRPPGPWPPAGHHQRRLHRSPAKGPIANPWPAHRAAQTLATRARAMTPPRMTGTAPGRQIGSECLIMPRTFPDRSIGRRLSSSGRGCAAPGQAN